MKDEQVINELKRIASENRGILLPEAVVQAAKPRTSPLHDYFEWDDSEAAKQWRIHTARKLINVCVELIGPKEDEREMRVFVSLRSDRDEGGYRLLDLVISTRNLRDQLLEDALEEMKYFREKYRDLQELAEVFEAMDNVLVHK
jgi:hypothetical protein